MTDISFIEMTDMSERSLPISLLIRATRSGGNSWKQKHQDATSYPTPPSAMANQPSAHARIMVADVLEPVESGMTYEAIIKEWRYEIDRDAIAKSRSAWLTPLDGVGKA